MECNRPLRTLLCALALMAGVLPARATHRDDFFDKTRKPNISFDKGTLTWTLRNEAIERVIRFDAKTGALRTLSFRDKRGPELKQVPGSEGTLVFAAPMLGAPTLLKNWKFTETPPPSQWTQPGYVDAAWKPATLPFKADQENKTYWFRALIPSSRMENRRAYALVLEHALEGEAEIYVDGELAQKITPADRPHVRVFQIDLLPINRAIGIKLTRRGASGGLFGGIGVAEVGTAPPALDLNSDWRYMIHSVNTGADDSKILTISLSGEKKHEGFDLDISYQIYSDREPYIAKWFTFVSHRTARFLVEQAIFDRWMLPGSAPQTQTYPGTGFVAADPVSRDGVLAAVLSPLGSSDLSEDGKSVSLALRPYYLMKTDVPQQTAKSLSSPFRGPLATGAFLYQLFTAQYIARATPTSVPATYNTRYGYGSDISAAVCEKIIPTAAALGAKVFVLDDGWQTNGSPNSGKYGDWQVDRRPEKFPAGLVPISILVRERNMRFGLWAAPALVNPRSQAASSYPDGLLLRSDGARFSPSEGTWMMCFSSGWEENVGQSLLLLCRELTVSYLRTDGPLFVDDCVVPAHNHPVGHSLATQRDHWAAFGEKMRKLDAAFVVDRPMESGPEVTGEQETGFFGDWTIAADPKAAADARGWYKNADATRAALSKLLWTRPPFTVSAAAPCHLPTTQPNLNALEYHLTSVAATVCNLELQGRLDQMTAQESDMVAKWVKWNADNRPWLAYAQPLTLGKPNLDGVLHLRNALDGRYGYLCLWNSSDAPDKATLSINPADYFVKMSDAQIVRLRDGKPVKFTRSGGALTLDVPMEALSWEIFEIRQGR